MKPVDKCAQLDERLATNKIGIDAYNRSKKNCAEKEKQDYLESPKGEQDMRDQEISEIGEAAAKQASETLQGYSGKFDMMKSWGIAKKQKEEESISRVQQEQPNIHFVGENLTSLFLSFFYYVVFFNKG